MFTSFFAVIVILGLFVLPVTAHAETIQNIDGTVYRFDTCDKNKIDRDIENISQFTELIRTPMTNEKECFINELQSAQKHGVKIAPTIILEGNKGANFDDNQDRILDAIKMINNNPQSVHALIIGQSMLYNYDLTVNQLQDYIVFAKDKLDDKSIKVSTYDAAEIWTDVANKSLADTVDFILFDDFPQLYVVQTGIVKPVFEDSFKITPDLAAITVIDHYNHMRSMYPDKEIVVETGFGTISGDKTTRSFSVSYGLDNPPELLHVFAEKLNSSLDMSYFIYESDQRVNPITEKYIVEIPDEQNGGVCFDKPIFALFGNKMRAEKFVGKMTSESNTCSFYPPTKYVDIASIELKNNQPSLVMSPLDDSVLSSVVYATNASLEHLKNNPALAVTVAGSAIAAPLLLGSIFSGFSVFSNGYTAMIFKQFYFYKRGFFLMTISFIAFAIYLISLSFYPGYAYLPYLLVIFYFFICSSMLITVRDYGFQKIKPYKTAILIICAVIVGIIYTYSLAVVLKETDISKFIAGMGLTATVPILIYTVVSYGDSKLEGIWKFLTIGIILFMIGVFFIQFNIGHLTDSSIFEFDLYGNTLVFTMIAIVASALTISGSMFVFIGLLKLKKTYHLPVNYNYA